jgi:hypothetical protein
LKKYLLLNFILLFISAKAQLISTKPTDIPLAPKNFNQDVIAKNKIKSILLVIADKPDGSVIIDKGATQGYEFDRTGKLTRYYYTLLTNTQRQEVDVEPLIRRGKVIRPASTRIITKYINDTIFVNVYYDDKDRITCKRAKTGDYYDAWYYEYNEQGKISKELHCRETNVSENKKEFKMGVQTILSSQTFVYTVLTATQTKKSCLNDEGREYKKATIITDAKGNVLTESYEFFVSWMKEEISMKYDATGRLTEKKYYSNESGDINSENVYEYDKTGLLISEKKSKNNVLLTEVNYLFDESTSLVKSEVNRDHKNSSIEIVKYDYSFYD